MKGTSKNKMWEWATHENEGDCKKTCNEKLDIVHRTGRRSREGEGTDLVDGWSTRRGAWDPTPPDRE
jgi:hypothetical protein